MNNGTFCTEDDQWIARVSQKTGPGALAITCHATEKTRPLQRKTLRGAANFALRQKIAGERQNTFTAG
ncbi:hypothetical protein RI103_23140 [Paraburkholderia sp. FT54]|uniref:hypothetical protein n=1 Tax=Paraburkholderia sp. FT54 TaxID=3074437 RepID=UPI002877B423|nr:hypothetical protein [Paraburkholderia sp. FT54]WNC93686.1 hypothetical protein RI103_23140 [Paraburkholderia sp. FT54]